jgi:signal transduction histidine kinase
MVAYRLLNVQRLIIIQNIYMPIKSKSIKKNDNSAFQDSANFEFQRLKSRIVTQISHEFRTPLTSIIGFAQMLEEDAQIDEKQRIEYANYIRNEGLRLTKLISDLIGLDSLEQGQVDFQFKEYEIQGTVRVAATLVAETAHNKSIYVSLEMPNEPIIIKFDRDKIVQVLYQLLHNAVRFTKPSGLVNTKVEIKDNHVVISIQDSGPGIPARDIPLLFERFGKVYLPGDEVQASGVGLAIVKYIVNRHNGDITVQSRVGEGSTFRVRIPIFS